MEEQNPPEVQKETKSKLAAQERTKQLTEEDGSSSEIIRLTKEARSSLEMVKRVLDLRIGT